MVIICIHICTEFNFASPKQSIGSSILVEKVLILVVSKNLPTQVHFDKENITSNRNIFKNMDWKNQDEYYKNL